MGTEPNVSDAGDGSPDGETETETGTETTKDVAVVGGGPAGLSAAIYTARNGLDTVVVDAGDPILRRNAHLENYPGFPAGVNSRLLLDLMRDQAEGAGAERVEGVVTEVERADDQGRFTVRTEDSGVYRTDHVVAATKNGAEYLRGIDGVGFVDRGKVFVDTDEGGRTGVEGLYAAGRLAEKPHQTAVAAGHGAEVAVSLLEDDDRPFYHDWVTPDGYFTDRGRDLPPGCEEIDEDERRRRLERATETMRDAFEEPYVDEQPTHPSLEGDR